MSARTVIIFGPTGNIGSVAARTAHDLGAKVVLAMRDTSKPIPGFTSEVDRVQADLTDPASLSAAVAKSGAKAAFLYSAHGARDGMKAALEALKSSGIEFVVFLSSYSIAGRAQDVSPEELIPFLHARVEMNLEEVFGPEGYMALRAGSLVTNNFRFKKGIQAGVVRMFGPPIKFDCVHTEDCGAVAGFYLAKGKKGGEEGSHVFVHGPEMVDQADAIKAIGKAIGVDVKVEEATEEQEWDTLVKKGGIPEHVARYFISKRKGPQAGVVGHVSPEQLRSGNETVERCTGRKAGDLDSWIERNKGLFSA